MSKVKVMLWIVLVLSSCAQAQIAKCIVLDEWALVGTNTIRKGTVGEISQWRNGVIYIAMVIGSTTAHTQGTVFHIQTSPVDSGNDAWFDQASYTMGQGITATRTLLDITPNAGSRTIRINLTEVDNWGRFNDDGIRPIFILGSVTVANSEILTLQSHTVGAASSVTIVDGLLNTPAASSTIWDWAGTYIYELPERTNRVRVLADNTYDPDGAIIYTYTALYGVRP